MTAMGLVEAEEAERAAQALCRVCYESLLIARSQAPSNATELAACRTQLQQAEGRHERVLAQLWRARASAFLGRCDVGA